MTLAAAVFNHFNLICCLDAQLPAASTITTESETEFQAKSWLLLTCSLPQRKSNDPLELYDEGWDLTHFANLLHTQEYSFEPNIIIIANNCALQKMKVISSLKDTINWFPGHMKKTLRIIEESTHKVDVFVEIRDARIPYCSRNPEFDLIIKRHQKEKLIIFNKYDLCDTTKTDKIIKDYNDYGIKCFAVSSQNHDDMRKILAYLKENYKFKYKQVGLWLMACGTPNVGKSSLINQIRSISDLQNKKAQAPTSASVCTTRGVGGFKILSNPLMYLMDTPGVMIPSVIQKQLGLKMAVLGIIKEQIVQKETIVNFIIEQSEADGNDKYWKNLRIEKPANSAEFLDSVRSKHKLYDYDAAYDRIITNFREGNLGKLTLDDPIVVK